MRYPGNINVGIDVQTVPQAHGEWKRKRENQTGGIEVYGSCWSSADYIFYSYCLISKLKRLYHIQKIKQHSWQG
jgi:hypothetical protein